MNNLHLNTKINLGIKLLIGLVILVMLHNACSIFNNLGILTDLFIIIGVYQSGRFLINKEVRTSVINKTQEIIDFENFDSFINNVIDLVNKNTQSNFEEGKEFKFSIDELLNDTSLPDSNNKLDFKIKTKDDSAQFNGLNKE